MVRGILGRKQLAQGLHLWRPEVRAAVLMGHDASVVEGYWCSFSDRVLWVRIPTCPIRDIEASLLRSSSSSTQHAAAAAARSTQHAARSTQLAAHSQAAVGLGARGFARGSGSKDYLRRTGKERPAPMSDFF